MLPNGERPYSQPREYRNSSARSVASSEPTVRQQNHGNAPPLTGIRQSRSDGGSSGFNMPPPVPDGDVTMRNAEGTPVLSGSAPRAWYDNLDPRRDNPTAYSSTSHAAVSGSRGPSIPSMFAAMPPAQVSSHSDTTAFQPGGGAPLAMRSARPSSANAGLSRASPAMGIHNILNPQPVRAYAASEPGQPVGLGLHAQTSAPGARSETRATFNHIHHDNNEVPPESPRGDSSDDQARARDAHGPQYQIPPIHYFQADDPNPEGRDATQNNAHESRSHVPPSNSSAHHQFPLPRIQRRTMDSRGVYAPPPQNQNFTTSQQHHAPQNVEDSRFYPLQQNPGLNQPPGFVSLNQFNALQQSITHGFQSVAALLATHRPTPLVHRRSHNRPSQNFTPMPPKCYGLPEHRPPEDNKLHDAIRKHFNELLGPDPLKVTVTMAESQTYSAHHLRMREEGRAPQPSTTAEDFRIDIAGLPRGPWNRSAVEVFIPHFAQSRSENIPINSDRWVSIREQALNRIQSLKAAYVEKQRGAQYSSNIKKRRRGAQRKEKRFHRRLEGAIQFNVAPVHINMLRQLGPAGMSSDESDWYTPDEGPSSQRSPRYYIHRPAWRNHQPVTFWLRIFDSLYQMYCNGKTDRRGARVRYRLEKGTRPEYSSRQGYPPGLPLNAYDEEWLRKKNIESPNIVRPSEDFTFQHDPDILEAVRKSRIRTEYDRPNVRHDYHD